MAVSDSRESSVPTPGTTYRREIFREDSLCRDVEISPLKPGQNAGHDERLNVPNYTSDDSKRK